LDPDSDFDPDDAKPTGAQDAYPPVLLRFIIPRIGRARGEALAYPSIPDAYGYLPALT
jgi:hypothetical protein